MSVKIGHAVHDENGKASGGKAGDQTGGEVTTRNWYNKPWTAVFRAKDPAMAEIIASCMEAVCANKYVGYDQGQRTTLYFQAKNCAWDASKIKTNCECDCSTLVAVCVNAAGIEVSKDMYTGNEKEVLEATKKFDTFTNKKYLTSDAYLKRGDILLGKGHTAVVLSNGSTVVAEFKPYLARITADALNVRSGAGTANKVNMLSYKGEVFLIDAINDEGTWGKLKNGQGWISLKYTEKV